MMKFKKKHCQIMAAVGIVIFCILLMFLSIKNKANITDKVVQHAVLSVALTHAQETTLPLRVPATGNVVAWQEASITAEGDGLKLTDVYINVGDSVKRGQVLALFNADIVAAELAEAQASLEQAKAAMLEAEVNAQRAKSLDKTGALSAQQVNQYLITAKIAQAKLDAARALEKKSTLRLAQTRVIAPNSGIITSRTATVGTVVPSGQELFRSIEDGRLEWRAIVASADIDKLVPGQAALITTQGRESIKGLVRIVAPTIDRGTHSGLVYVDLPPNSGIRAGLFARGYFEVSKGVALTLPQSAVILKDGFHYVMQVGANSVVIAKKVTVGQQVGERIEITAGLAPYEAVIISGLSFLSEGDLVKVVTQSTSSPASSQERN